MSEPAAKKMKGDPFPVKLEDYAKITLDPWKEATLSAEKKVSFVCTPATASTDDCTVLRRL